jgi:hypothetical protein
VLNSLSTGTTLPFLLLPCLKSAQKDWTREQHNQIAGDLYTSPRFVSVLKSRGLRWALKEEITDAFRILIKTPWETELGARGRDKQNSYMTATSGYEDYLLRGSVVG